MQPQALPGFRDFYPAELAFRSHLFATWRAVAGRYGFEEYDGPPLEPLELYTAKSGDEIVGQLYNFTDKGDRAVALRPEMTPTLARMVAARANGLRKPIRWFSIPQLFRYERQQRGRLREHFQLNCDLIGEAGPLADAEIIALAIDVMRALGLTSNDVKVRISDRRIVDALLASLNLTRADVQATVYRALDVVRKAPGQAMAMLAAAFPAGSLVGRGHEAFTRLTTPRPFADDELHDFLQSQGVPPDAYRHLFLVLEGLRASGLSPFVEIDLTIVRGLAYYTGTVFELFDSKGEFRAICGGGRYDNLTSALGGVDLPAVGFGMGDVVLGELLKERGLAPATPASIDVFVAGITAEDQPEVLAVAHRLRDTGIRTEFALGAQAVGKQMKLADARHARLAVVIGPDDRARGEVMLKDLDGKAQRAVKAGELVPEVRRALGMKE
jgi:histidyl-tRNA synthetase